MERALLSAAHQHRITPELLGLAAGSAASLAAIDVVYVAKGRIAPSYVVDVGEFINAGGGLRCLSLIQDAPAARAAATACSAPPVHGSP